MTSEGLDEVRVGASDIPNVDNIPSSSCNQPSIRRETAIFSSLGGINCSHSCSKIPILDCNDCPIARGKLGAIWGEGKMGATV